MSASQKDRYCWKWIAIAVPVACVGAAVLTYKQAYSMMHFTTGGERTPIPEELSALQKLRIALRGIQIPKPMTPGVPSDLSPETQPLEIRASDGATLAAWYAPVDGAKSLVILFHGYADDKVALLREARAFRDLGCAAMLVDCRGYGKSSESYTTIGYREAMDVTAAIEYARANYSYRRVILYGQSMGSAAILRAIAKYNITADGIIIEGVFDSLLNAVRNRFHSMGFPSFPCAELLVFWGGRLFGFNGFAHNPVEYASNVICPALVMHGEHDPRSLASEAISVFRNMRGPKQYREFADVGHESYLACNPEEWKMTVRQFLDGL